MKTSSSSEPLYYVSHAKLTGPEAARHWCCYSLKKTKEHGTPRRKHAIPCDPMSLEPGATDSATLNPGRTSLRKVDPDEGGAGKRGLHRNLAAQNGRFLRIEAPRMC